MELVEAAAIIGATETTRTYFGRESYKIADIIEIVRNYWSIILNREWSWGWTASILSVFSVLGTFSNYLFLSSLKMSNKLFKTNRENIFLTCLGWSDLIITTVVVPVVIVLVMFRLTDSTRICHMLQLVTQTSSYIYSVSYMIVSIDIYNQMVSDVKDFFKHVKIPSYAIVFFNLSISLVSATLGVYYGLDYDYCHRKHEGNFWFRWVTIMMFYVIPCFITTNLFLKTTDFIRLRLSEIHRNSQHIMIKKDERDLCLLHTSCYYLFVIAWIPYLLTVTLFPDTSNAIYYAFTWIGLVRSGITSLLYGAVNKNFRKVFVSVLLYLFCKVKITRPVRNRRLRRMENEARMQNNRILARDVAERPSRPTTPVTRI